MTVAYRQAHRQSSTAGRGAHLRSVLPIPSFQTGAEILDTGCPVSDGETTAKRRGQEFNPFNNIHPPLATSVHLLFRLSSTRGLHPANSHFRIKTREQDFERIRREAQGHWSLRSFGREQPSFHGLV